MDDESHSLWPNDLATVVTVQLLPEDILREQAGALDRVTGGRLRGEVERGSQGEWVTVNFYVVAPRLEDYKYRLFKVRHKVPDPFAPLEIIDDSKVVRRVRSRAEFEKSLSDIFASEATRSIVGQLLTMSSRPSD